MRRPTARYSADAISPKRLTKSTSRAAAKPSCDGHPENPFTENAAMPPLAASCSGSELIVNGIPSLVVAAIFVAY